MSKDHIIDTAKIACHTRAIEKIKKNPDCLSRIRDILEAQLHSGDSNVVCLATEWLTLVNNDRRILFRFMLSEDVRARRLRQRSPFDGLLDRVERLAIFGSLLPYCSTSLSLGR